MGRLGVDIYPLQIGVGAARTSRRSASSSAAARPTSRSPPPGYGRRTALITRTGADPFGEFLHQALRGFGVDDRFVTPVPDLPTPVTFCEIFPPDDFPLYFYRQPDGARPGDPRRRARPRRDPGAPRLLGHRHRPVRGAEPRGHPGRAGGPRPGSG